ncbi:MAG: hypothetical protein A2W26_02770 [Acidobacteria bacterium RBG_16_64_8]|nr:MAG: hypothetical protein A2W26_02770 [Acidobacteria bacterium RBG_16_64_8]
MADKKVERTGRERPLTPKQKMEAALSDPGTMNMAETTHDKGKSALVDKFREREERWRREQARHGQQAAHANEPARQAAEEPTATVDRPPPSEGATEPAEPAERGADGGL